MSEQLTPEAITINIIRARGGWIIASQGGLNAGNCIAKSPREVLIEVARSIGLSGIPADMKIAEEHVERAMLLLGSLHDQMRRGALMVIGDGSCADKRKLDKDTTMRVADDIKAALAQCGYGDQQSGA